MVLIDGDLSGSWRSATRLLSSLYARYVPDRRRPFLALYGKVEELGEEEKKKRHKKTKKRERSSVFVSQSRVPRPLARWYTVLSFDSDDNKMGEDIVPEGFQL